MSEPTRTELLAKVQKLQARVAKMEAERRGGIRIFVVEIHFHAIPEVVYSHAYFDLDNAIDYVLRHSDHLVDRPGTVSSDVAALLLREQGWVNIFDRLYKVRSINLS